MKVLMLIIIIELIVLLKKSLIKDIDIIEDIILAGVRFLSKIATLVTEII